MSLINQIVQKQLETIDHPERLIDLIRQLTQLAGYAPVSAVQSVFGDEISNDPGSLPTPKNQAVFDTIAQELSTIAGLPIFCRPAGDHEEEPDLLYTTLALVLAEQESLSDSLNELNHIIYELSILASRLKSHDSKLL